MALRKLSMSALLLCAAFASAANAQVPVKPVHHKLANTYIVWGNSQSGIVLSAGYTNVDSPMTIACAGPNGCTFAIDAMVGVGKPLENNTEWSICAMVDGVLVASPPCPVQGELIVGGHATGDSRQSIQVAKGKHTVQTQVYLRRDNAQLFTWHITYSVFRP